MLKPSIREIIVSHKRNGKKEPSSVQVVTLRPRGQNYFYSLVREALIKNIGKEIEKV